MNYLVYLFLSVSTIRATRTQIEMRKNLIFFDNRSLDDIVCVFSQEFSLSSYPLLVSAFN